MNRSKINSKRRTDKPLVVIIYRTGIYLYIEKKCFDVKCLWYHLQKSSIARLSLLAAIRAKTLLYGTSICIHFIHAGIKLLNKSSQKPVVKLRVTKNRLPPPPPIKQNNPSPLAPAPPSWNFFFFGGGGIRTCFNLYVLCMLYIIDNEIDFLYY